MIIIVVTRSDTIGGVHMHIFDKIKVLELQNVEYKILVGGNSQGIFIDKLKSLNIPYEICPFLYRKISLINDIKALLFIIRYLKKNRASLIWGHSSKAGILIRLASIFTNIPSVFTIHGWSFSSTRNKLIKFIYLFIEKLLLNSSKLNIFVCEYDYLIGLKNNLKSKRFKIIHNSCDKKSKFKKTRNNIKKIKFVMVARLDKQKDHVTVIKAFREINKKYKNWEIIFAGDGPLKEELEKIVVSYGLSKNIKFLGFVSNINDLLEQSDVFILASHWEGFPITIVEAISYGLPIVVSDVCGSKEAVLNKLNGLIFDEGDYIQLQQNLEIFFVNPNKIFEMSKISKLIYDNVFSFKRFEIKMRKVLDEVY